MDMSTTHQCSGRQLIRELITRQVRTRGINTILRRLHISHTATTIEVVDNQTGVIFDFKEQTLGTGHITLVTTTIQVTHLTRQQVPRRSDAHLRLVVTTKETTYLIGTTTRLREGGVDTHLLEASCSE